MGVRVEFGKDGLILDKMQNAQTPEDASFLHDRDFRADLLL